MAQLLELLLGKTDGERRGIILIRVLDLIIPEEILLVVIVTLPRINRRDDQIRAAALPADRAVEVVEA